MAGARLDHDHTGPDAIQVQPAHRVGGDMGYPRYDDDGRRNVYHSHPGGRERHTHNYASTYAERVLPVAKPSG